MKRAVAVAFLIFVSAMCHAWAQDLTVHIVDQDSKKPVAQALVRLHYGCSHSTRPIELKQKTDSAGTVVFRSVSLKPLEFCVFPDLDAFASQELPYLFAAPQEDNSKSLNNVFTVLPADVTFHVRRRSFLERIRHYGTY